MKKEPLVFQRKGFPSIHVFDTYFEIKAIDYWEFRTFNYSEIKEIKHFNPNNKWWNILLIATSLTAQLFSEDDLGY